MPGYAFAQTHASVAQVTSNTTDGDYGPGHEIDIVVNFTEPIRLETVPIRDSRIILSFESDPVVQTMQADGKRYALIGNKYDANAHPITENIIHSVDIVDITDPSQIRIVAQVHDPDYVLNATQTIDVASIGGNQYAVVGGVWGDIQLIDVTDPENPSPSGVLRREDGDSNFIDSILGTTTVQIGYQHYALVASNFVVINGTTHPGAFAVVNITDPASPAFVSGLLAGSGHLAGVTFKPDLAAAQIGGHHYALATSFARIAILNVTDPGNVTRAGTIIPGQDGIASFGIHRSTVAEIDGHHYALATSKHHITGGLYIVNITDPARPSGVANFTGTQGGFAMINVEDLTAVNAGEKHYALVEIGGNIIIIIDITDPAAPSVVGSVAHDLDGFRISDVRFADAVTINSRHYVPVGDKDSDTFKLLDITDPSMPAFGRNDGVPKFDEILRAYGVATIKIGGTPYAVVAAFNDDGVQIIDMSDPSYPVPVASIADGRDDFETLHGAFHVDTAKIGDGYYALVTANDDDDGIQIINITDPARPSPAASITLASEGFGGIVFFHILAVAEIGGHHYALVSNNGNHVHVIDVTQPDSPLYVSNATNGQGGFVLDGTGSIVTTEIDGRHYALAINFNDDSLQIIDVTNPARPAAAGLARNGQDGFTELSRPKDVTTAEIAGRHYALVTGKGLQIIDITNPYSLSSAGAFGAPLDEPTGIEVIESGGRHYALVASTQGRFDFSHLYVINVTDPSSPSLLPATVAGDGTDTFGIFGQPYSMPTVEVSGRQYVIIPGNFYDGLAVVDLTDPTDPTNAFLPHIRLDLGERGDGHAVYAGQGADGHSMTFRYVVGPGDHTPDLSYYGTGALHAGRTFLLGPDEFQPLMAVLPEPGATGSLSQSKNIRVFGTDPGTHFVTTWEVSSPNGSVAIPDGGSGGEYTVYWGDGEYDQSASGDRSHEYAEAGRYTVAVSEGIPRIWLGGDYANAASLLSIDQWGTNRWDSMAAAFKGASGMNITAQDAPDLSGVASAKEMFRDSSVNADLSGWNVSSIEDMSHMFDGASSFDRPLSSWDVSRVTDMSHMFDGASSFDRPLSSWDVSRVTDMSHMFAGALRYDWDMSSWNVSNVADMSSMFDGASSFDQPIGSWDVSNVADMSSMFDGAGSFRQNLGEWYIILDDASIDRSDVPGAVGAVLPQNAFLKTQDPDYSTGAGGDPARFSMIGDRLHMGSAGNATSYDANITASGDSVFGHSNWRVAGVALEGGSPPPPNTPPAFDLGAPRIVNEGDAVTIAVTVFDPDPTFTLTYEWSQVSPANPAIPFENDTAPAARFTAPDVSRHTDVSIQLAVSDGRDSATDRVRITILDTDSAGTTPQTNRPPVVGAGPDLTVAEGGEASLDGTASDPDSDTLTYEWSQVLPAAPEVTFANSAALDTALFAPQVSQHTNVTIHLVVSDGSHTVTDQTIITILDTDSAGTTPQTNRPPVVGAGPDLTVAEGGEASLDGTASDPDSDTLTYEWSQVLPAAPEVTFANSAALGTALFAPQVSQHTNVTIHLVVSDGNHTVTDQAIITILDSESATIDPEPPVDPDAVRIVTRFLPGGSGSSGGGGGGGGGSGFDPDSDTLTYSWTYGPDAAVTVTPANVTAGNTVSVAIPLYDPGRVSHFSIYLDIRDYRPSDPLGDARIVWDSGNVRIIDPNEIIRDASVTVSEADRPDGQAATLHVTFSESAGDSSPVMRAWSMGEQVAGARAFGSLVVVQSVADPESNTVDPEPTAPPVLIDPEPAADQDSAGRSMLAIRMWSGFEPEPMTGARLLDSLGLDYPGVDIPSWVMTELGPLVSKGSVTVDEFKAALEYVLENS